MENSRPRPLVAMIVCLGLFLVWSIWQQNDVELQQEQRREQQARRAQKDLAEGARQPRGGDGKKDGDGEARGADADAVEPAAPKRPVHEEKTTTFQSDFLDLRLVSRQGGGVAEARLPEFRGARLENAAAAAAGQREVLVFLPELSGEPPALALRVTRLGDLALEKGELPDLAAEPWEMAVAADDTMVTFTNALATDDGVEKGITVERKLTFDPAWRHVGVEVTFENRSDSEQLLGYRIWGGTGARTETSRGPGSDLQVAVARVAKNGPPVVEGPTAVSGVDPKNPQSWGGSPTLVCLQNNYFSSILAAVDTLGAPGELNPVAVSAAWAEPFLDADSFEELFDEFLKKEYPGRRRKDLREFQLKELTDQARDSAIKTARTYLTVDDLRLRPGESTTQRYIFFLGPRDDDVLSEYANLNFVEVNDYGMWGWIVLLFMKILRVFHSVTFSWGLSIVCLTLVVRTALHPLNRRQQTGMMRYQKKIQKIQPQINELKEHFKDDKMKMNQEMQKLFKENGINPMQMMGGCMMMLLQFPVWIALIGTLNYSIDLRLAAFLGWIDDLSRADRLLVFDHSIWWLPTDLNLLPCIYVALMLVQQKLQPKATDPQAQQQQRMMSFMMLGFGFIFYGFASGLLVYFITSAIFGIIESRLIKRKLAREDEAGGLSGGLAPVTAGGPAGGGALYGSSRAVAKKKKPKKQKRLQ